MVSAAVAIVLSQLAGSDNESDRDKKNNTTQAYSTNSDKKVCLKIILKKSKRGQRRP